MIVILQALPSASSSSGGGGVAIAAAAAAGGILLVVLIALLLWKKTKKTRMKTANAEAMAMNPMTPENSLDFLDPVTTQGEEGGVNSFCAVTEWHLESLDTLPQPQHFLVWRYLLPMSSFSDSWAKATLARLAARTC